MSQLRLAVEESDLYDSYKSVHATGCHDLHDPFEVDELHGVDSPSREQVADALEGYAFETYNDVIMSLKPCARAQFKAAGLPVKPRFPA